MRIAVGGYSHETNAFGSILVTEEAVAQITLTADRYFQTCTGVRSGHGGYIDEANELGIELIPTICMNPGPSGPTTKAAYEGFRDKMVALMWQTHCEEPLDGIMLNMHGAGVADGYVDLEGDILRTLRARFGADMPISMRLDLHGNISPEMIDLCDVTVGFKCYPHVDDYECGRTALRLLHDMIQSGKRYGKALVKLPWHLPSGFGVTLSGPAHDVQQYMLELVKKDGELLDATFFHGFPYADVDFAGVSVVTVAKTQEAADRCAKMIADYAWSRRKDFTAPINSAAEAMDQAEKAQFPVVINESSDNPGGGAPGDGTHLLREMLRRDIPGSAFGYISDPEVVKLAVSAGVGNRITCTLGGKHDNIHGAPILLENAYVKTISDGSFIQKNPMGAGGRSNWGPTVLLIVGNVQIVVSTARAQTMDDAPFRMTGIDWCDQRILALKSSHHFKGWWAGRVKTIIPCDSPGIHSSDLHAFRFKNLNMTYFPFRDAEWK